MHRAIVLVALAWLVLLPASAQDPKAVEQQLEAAYRDKVLTIRGFYGGSWLRYDADGNPLDGGKPGPWTLTGKIEVKDIKLTEEKCEILGTRLWLAYDRNKKEFEHLRTKDKVRIEVRLGKDNANEVAVRRAFDKIFLWGEDQLLNAVPDYWRSFLVKDEPQPVQPGERVQFPPGGVGSVYRVGGKVSAPVCISCPAPEYPTAARAAQVNGLVVLWAIVDEEGRIQSVRIQVPAGLGFDDAAVATAKKWRFKPAERAGKPVPVAMAIEMKFNLY